MSIILDALKKSEGDRQRHSGPALFEVKVAPPRSTLPPWAIAIALLLAVNLGVVGWLLVRHAGARSLAASVPERAPAPPAAALPAPAAPRTMTPAAVAAPSVAPAVVAAAPPAAPAPPTTPPAAPATAPTNPGPLVSAPQASPDDYAPAAEPPPDTAFGHVRRATDVGVPLYQQAASAPGAQLPQLRLDLHAYAERPQDRWVMINMHKLREGESLPEGVRVERIIPEGAVLSYQGSQFLLPRD